MHPARRIRLFFFFTIIFAAVSSAAAERVVLQLDRKNSNVAFQLRSPVTNAQGKLNEYSGGLELGATGIPTGLTFTANVSNAAVQGGSPYESLLWQNLVTSFPQPAVSFRSKEIKALSAHRYDVKGLLNRGAKQYQVNFPVTVTKTSPELYTVRADVSGTLDLPDDPVFQALPELVRGELNGNFVFRNTQQAKR